MLLYIIIAKPFDRFEGNFINIYNELVIVFSFFSVVIMSNRKLSDIIMNIWGWILTIFVIISLLITWYFILPEVFRQLKEAIINCFTKKPGKVENKSSGMKKKRAKNDDKAKESIWNTIKYGESRPN